MTTPEDVEKLAALSRLAITDAERDRFANELGSILEYVGQLESLAVTKESAVPALHNVLREDGEPHTAGAYTEKLAEQFPERKGDVLSVKQILSND